MFYAFIKAQNLPKWSFTISLTLMWTASFFNVGVISFDGNIQVKSDILKHSQQQIDFLTSRLNRNDVLVLDTTHYYYMYQSYALYQADQMFVEPQNADIISQNRKLYVAEPFGEKYNEYIRKFYLKAMVPPIAIFDPLLPPGPLNQILEKRGNNIVKVDDRTPALFAFVIPPSGANAPQELFFSLLPDEQRILSFMMAQPLDILKNGLSDGVSVNFILIEKRLEHQLLMVNLGPSDKTWVPVEIKLPALSEDAALKISVTCRDKKDCRRDEVLLAPIAAQ